MHQGRDFIVFSDDCGWHPSSCQHLFRRIATGNRVLWVETIGLRSPKLTVYDLRRIAEKLRNFARRDMSSGEVMWAPVPDGLVRYSPPMHPFYGNRIGALINDVVLERLIRDKARSLGMTRPLLVTTVPNVAGLIGHLGECASVYYCVDDFKTWPGFLGDAIQRMEGELVRKADALAVTASHLIAGLARPGRPVLHLPHGVDVEMFSAGGPEPAPIASVPRPRLMSLGLWDKRVDVGLLEVMATRRPDWHVVLVGKRTVPPCGLDSLPNVHVFPQVPYRDVPAWLAAADVLMIPYSRNEQTDTLSPLKLREFLATGCPIMVTGLPEIVKAGQGLIPTGDGADAFIAAAQDALNRAGESAARQALVRDESWEARARNLLDFVDPLFDL